MKDRTLPSGWKLEALGKLSSAIQYGYTAKAQPEPVGPRLLRITDIQNDTVRWDEVPFCRIQKEEKQKYLLTSNDIVFARTGATVGKSYLIRDPVPDSVFASYLIRVRLTDEVAPKYIAYFFKSADYWRQITESQAGIGQPNVNGTKLAQIEIPVAPAEQQQRIVAEIEKQFSRLDEAVASLKRTKANLKRYKAAVLKAAVEGKLTEDWRKQHPDIEPASKLLERILDERRGKWNDKGKYKEPDAPITNNLPSLPRGWVWASAVQCCDAVVDCHNKTAPYTTAGIPLVRTSNIRDGKLMLEDVRYVDQPTYAFWSRRCPPAPGDVLFTREAPMGEAAVVPPDLKLCMGQRMMLMRPSGAITAPFLLYALMSSVIKRIIDRTAVGSGVKHLRVGDAEILPVPVPPITEQEQIVDEVERRLSVIDELEATVEANLARADRLRQSILQHAFSGKLLLHGVHP